MVSSWDAIVVGAGPAGCLAADRLTARGLRVLVVDAGPRSREGTRLAEVDPRVWAYSTVGASFDWYRVRAVGGRSLLWGGWCCRFPDLVLRRGGFPWRAEALAPLYDELEQRLGVVEGCVDERYRVAARALDVSIVPKRGPVVSRGRMWSALRTTAAAHARTYRLSVKDRGKGLPEGAGPRVFEPFFSTRRDGSGLGLAVCYGLVAAHGGSISAADRPGGGVEVRIDLPERGASAP